VLDSGSTERPALPADEAANEEPRVELLVLRLRGERYALAVQQVGGVDERRPVTPLPGTPPGVIGVFSRLGDVLPALDLAMLLQDAASPTQGGLFAVGQSTSGPVALLVDEVEAVVTVETSRIEAPLPTLAPTRARLLRGQIQIDGNWVSLLDLEGIVATVAGWTRADRG
jgi:purine-binding chemotaxis protein CheW